MSPSSPCRDCPDRTVDPNCHDPERCERCAYCRATKEITEPRVLERIDMEERE